jgi:hypothetical protein
LFLSDLCALSNINTSPSCLKSSTPPSVHIWSPTSGASGVSDLSFHMDSAVRSKSVRAHSGATLALGHSHTALDVCPVANTPKMFYGLSTSPCDFSACGSREYREVADSGRQWQNRA